MRKNVDASNIEKKKDANKRSSASKAYKRLHAANYWLIAYDVLVSVGAYFLALWLRFDCSYSQIEPQYLYAWANFAPAYSVICVIVFWFQRIYKSIWRFASYNELIRVFNASLITGVIHALGISLVFCRMPASYYIVGFGIQFLFVLSVRFAYRLIILEREKLKMAKMQANASRIMLIGAGAAGQIILRGMRGIKNGKEYVCCIIDDDESKWGKYIDAVPIVGGRDDILLNVDKYKIDKIYLAIPAASAAERRDILDICKETGCELKNLPSMDQIVNGKTAVSSMKEVAVEDLLGRDTIKVQMDEIYGFLAGKVILVTGGGGSIGSELCRQIASHKPKQLVIFDIYENNAHAIQLELKDKYPDLDLVVLIGSVRDSRRINQVFEKYKPEIVYHAAAHKHVPLMEYSPCEAIKNNAIGTYKTAHAALINGCKRFVLISTDKAVNPTNIMGASKRICEMIIQYFDKMVRDGNIDDLCEICCHERDKDEDMIVENKNVESASINFVAVRFGNVLGSNGSVVPRFKEQIANGGPVTVTHPDIVRYFMTIPEATSLVLQAGVYANGGEIFVLDMGAPVKIDTLARNLIRLSGLKPDVDIKISYTGLRPGEKLYEEKLMSEEGLRKTPNNLIHIGSPVAFDTDKFSKQLKDIMEFAYNGEDVKVCELVKEIVGTYNPIENDEHESFSAMLEEKKEKVMA